MSRHVFLLALAFVGLGLAVLRAADAPVKVACLGEQTTHSFHRQNDPEYPQFLGEALDPDFAVDATAAHPNAGGFLYGGGTHYRIGNFGHPRGTVLDHAMENPKAVIRSDELKLAEKFAPDVVILGPFGDHESQCNTSMDHFTADLKKLLERIHSFSSKPAILVALPLPRGGKDEDANYRRIRDETRKVAEENHLRVIDLWTEFLGQAGDFQDATHLTIPGRRHLARVMADAVVRWKTSR